MKQVLILIALFFLIGCGSRKTEKYKKSTVENIQATEIAKTEVAVLQLTKEQLSSLIFEIEIRGDSLTTDAEGNSKLSNPQINIKGTQQNETKTDSLKIDSKTDSSLDLSSHLEDDEQDKKTEKKQFNWWYVLPSLIVFLCVAYRFVIRFF